MEQTASSATAPASPAGSPATSPAAAAAPAETFAASTAELAPLLAEPVRIALPALGCLRVEGADAAAFLQSQLTSDVAQQPAGELRLGGYCTAKGRLIATFHQWRDGDAVMLQLPREMLAGVAKRLSMFVLRAKVKIVDASAQTVALAVAGPGAAAALRAAGLAVGDATWSSVADGALRASRLPPGPRCAERFLLAARADQALPAALQVLRTLPSTAWWWSEVDAAVPTVFAATQEKFVPQMINFEVLGGVNFRKGCYPGQEIVARSQYLGKLKRRMQRAHAAQAAPPVPGADVFHSTQAEPVGTVVMAASAPQGGVDVLFEAPVDRLAGGSLHLQAADGTPLALLPLPYELNDPTA